MDRLGSAYSVELPQQRLDVKFHRVLRDAELTRDRLVAETIADRGENLDLSRRKQIQLLFRDGIEGRSGCLHGAYDQFGGDGADRRVDLLP
jgi:hypothetical protein